MIAWPLLTVIIPCRNVAATLGAQLEALAKQRVGFPWEVVVVDNGSTDSTAAVAGSYAETLPMRVIPWDTPGLNRARNAGVRAARADFVALCDGDDVVADGWLESMHRALTTHDYVTGPVELDRLNPPDLASSRGRKGGTGVPYASGAFPFARGCNLGVRRSVLAAVGGFDDEAPYPVDDQELGLRMHLAGVHLHYEPSAVVHYRYRSGTLEIFRQGLSYGFNRVGLYVTARRAGVRVHGRLRGLRSWVWFAVHLLSAVKRSGRLALLWVLGNRVGQLCGSLRWRTVYL